MLESKVNYALPIPAYACRQMATMGERIKTLRQSRRLTQDQLGEIVGVTGASISQWELGTTKGIKPENFLRFCAHFQVDPYWVAFGDEGDSRTAPKRERG